MKFIYKQPKRKGDIKCDKDCMIRAVANISKREYKLVHTIMYKHGWRATRKRSKGKWEQQITKTLDELGIRWERVSFPAAKGQKRMVAKELSKMDPKGKYIIRVARHVSVLSEGKLLDTWDCSDKCIYFAWKIN